MMPLQADADFEVLVLGLPDGLQDAAKSPGMPSVIYGAVLIIVLFLLPRGAASFLTKLSLPLTKRL